jgi:hypothetical protein
MIFLAKSSFMNRLLIASLCPVPKPYISAVFSVDNTNLPNEDLAKNISMGKWAPGPN